MLSYALHFAGDENHRQTHTVLCVNNLSRFPQPVELDLREHIGAVPIELTGGTPFPRIGQLPVPADAARPRLLLVRLTDPSEGDG